MFGKKKRLRDEPKFPPNDARVNPTVANNKPVEGALVEPGVIPGRQRDDTEEFLFGKPVSAEKKQAPPSRFDDKVAEAKPTEVAANPTPAVKPSEPAKANPGIPPVPWAYGPSEKAIKDKTAESEGKAKESTVKPEAPKPGPVRGTVPNPPTTPATTTAKPTAPATAPATAKPTAPATAAAKPTVPAPTGSVAPTAAKPTAPAKPTVPAPAPTAAKPTAPAKPTVPAPAPTAAKPTAPAPTGAGAPTAAKPTAPAPTAAKPTAPAPTGAVAPAKPGPVRGTVPNPAKPTAPAKVAGTTDSPSLLFINNKVDKATRVMESRVKGRPVYLIDMTEDKSGGKYVPGSAIRSFIGSSKLPGGDSASTEYDIVDIVGLIASASPGENPFLVIAGADYLVSRVYKSFEKDSMVMDLLAEKVSDTIAKAEKAGVTIVVITEDITELLSDFMNRVEGVKEAAGSQV